MIYDLFGFHGTSTNNTKEDKNMNKNVMLAMVALV